MAFTISNYPGTGVLVVRGEGDGSLEESRQVLAALESQSLIPRAAGVIFDVRALAFIPSPEEARLIAQQYGAAGARNGWRMAYVAPPGAQYGVARMVEMLSQQHGVAAGTFTSMEVALAWFAAAPRPRDP